VFGGDPEPIKLRPEERTEAETVYDHWGASIDAYEQSVQVSNFHVEIRRVREEQIHDDCRRDGRLQPFQRQGQLQLVPRPTEEGRRTQVRRTPAQSRRRTLLCSPASGRPMRVCL